MIVRKLITLLGFDVDEAGANEYEKKLDSLADKAASLVTKGAALTAMVTAPVTLALNRVLGTAGDYEAIMNRVQAAGGYTEDGMDRLGAAAERLSAATGRSVTDVALTMEELTKAGVSIDDILGGVAEQALKVSIATGAASDAAGNLIHSALSVFKESVDMADETASTVVGFTNATSMGFSDVELALTQGGAAAAMAGMTFEEFLAVLAAMPGQFQSGSDAGTAFKSAIMSMMNPTKQARDVMDQYGLSFYDANGKMKEQSEIADMLAEKLGSLSDEQRDVALTTMFGADGFRYAGGLMNATSEGIDRATASMREQGDVAAASEAATKGYVGALAKLSAAFELLSIKIGESGLLEFMTNAVEKGTEFVGWLSTVSPRLLRFGTFGAMAAAALGPLLVLIGGLVIAIATIGGPLVAAAAGIAALTGAIAAFWPEISALVSSIDLTAIGTAITDVFGNAFDWVKENWAALLLGFPGVVFANVRPDLFKPIQDAFEAALSWLRDKWTGFTSWLSDSWAGKVASWVGGKASEFNEWASTPMTVHPNALPGAPGRAGGGAVSSGQPYTVGESGKELFMPTRDGVILPNGITRALEAMTNAAALSGGYRAPEPTRALSAPVVNNNSFAVSVTVPEGTTGEQAQSIFEQFEVLFDRRFGDHIQHAVYDFPTMETV